MRPSLALRTAGKQSLALFRQSQYRGRMANDALATQNNLSGWDPEGLEQRVQRLEDAVASLQDTRPLEERVVQRVTERLHGRPVLPADQLADKISTSPPPARTSFPKPPISSVPPTPELARPGWMLLDAFRELGTVFRMFFDVRYHMAWSTRLVVLVLLALILLTPWWLPFGSIFVLGWLLGKIVDLVLAFFIYKALSREAQRYRLFKQGERQGR
jgi:hypothetical protein